MNSDEPGDIVGRTQRRGFYFYLSYAHSAPATENPNTEADSWVSEFFSDLRAAVAGAAAPGSTLDIGFYDRQVPPETDLKAELSDALGRAEVFVPLYSPGYFKRAWPLRERGAFERRLVGSGGPDGRLHVVPVLWTPFPSWNRPDVVDEALALGAGIPEYEENGVRALRMLRSYREAYGQVLANLTERIIDAAERHPLGPAPALDLDRVVPAASTDPGFVVSVLAAPPAGAHDDPLAWSPFVEPRSLPVAEYVAGTAERLGLDPRVMDLDRARALLGRTPAVVIVDPGILERPDGRSIVSKAFGDAPEWVVPLVVCNPDDARYPGGILGIADRAVTLLEALRPTTAPRADGLDELVGLLPGVITRARRTYLKRGRVWPPGNDNTSRPRLGGPTESPTSEQGTELQ